jgi:RimJ/RimL family protein N-acetyltransferase
VEIARLGPEHILEFRELRLRGFRDSPEAFGSSYEEQLAMPVEQFAAKSDAVMQPGDDRFVAGAFDDSGRLVGIAGFYREAGLKNRHKGVIWGMYVLPEARRTGVARALLSRIISDARSLDDLRQVCLAVESSNVPARRLYLSLGFISYGTEPDALKIGARFYDEDLMVLFLKPRTSLS